MKDLRLTLLSPNRHCAGYFEKRRQSIVVGEQLSTPCALRYGVPQGSILESLLFTLNNAPLQDVSARHNSNSLFYADDTTI